MPKTLLVVTGASRGLGRSITKSFCQKDCHVLLIARSETGLQDTHAELPASCTVELCVADLSNLSSLETFVDTQLLPKLNRLLTPEISRLIFVNNAGSLGPIGPCLVNCSLAQMQQVFDFNITSALFLSARLMKWAAEKQQASDTSLKETVLVNISSLVAVQAFPSLALYSAGKAARDLYHSALAQEHKDGSVRILNYAPGPLETDMTTEIRRASALDVSLKPHYDKTLVDPNDSANKLVELVNSGNFNSGDHVDYFDLLPEDSKPSSGA